MRSAPSTSRYASPLLEAPGAARNMSSITTTFLDRALTVKNGRDGLAAEQMPPGGVSLGLASPKRDRDQSRQRDHVAKLKSGTDGTQAGRSDVLPAMADRSTAADSVTGASQTG